MRGRESCFDVAILGNGPAGKSLALALADTPLSVALLDSSATGRPRQADRTLALALGSRRILSRLGVPLPLPGAAPIRSVQITQQGFPGRVRLDWSMLEAPERMLGEVLALDVLEDGLERSLSTRTQLVRMASGPVQTLHWHPDHVAIHAGETTVGARLAVIADGGHGGLRRLAGLGRVGWDHNRFAIVATVTPRKDPQGIAYEHFLDSGPLAFLPYGEGRFSIVWSLLPAEASRVLAMRDSEFLQALNGRLPPGLGPMINTGPRLSFALAFQHLWAGERQRLALVGNASQTLHPVAGQGFNLGLRDVMTLAALLKRAAEHGEDPGAAPLLSDYARIRRRDRWETISFTESLNRLFSTNLLPLKLVRAAGLAVFDRLPAQKHRFAARAAGLWLPTASLVPELMTEAAHV